jgi:hypothetical protein
MPEIPGVKEAYLGILPGSEFLRLVQDESGAIIRSIFYDNVRDWQDYSNPVNRGIRQTMEDSSLRTRFALMNNGITIIAKSLRATGNRITIDDYQIVNGCQTSHVLHDQRSVVDDTVMVPIRVIATQDEDVIASIIKATNRQTYVDEEQLLALSDFQKKLERFFQSFENGRKLYFERRPRQYNVSGIEKTRIVTRTNLIRDYASLFLGLPDRATKHYGEIRQRVGTSIFHDDHRLEPYYVAALAMYKLEFFFRNGVIDAKYKAARYHVLFAFRLLAGDPKLPAASSHEMERYCRPLMEKLWNAIEAERIFREITGVIDTAANGNLARDHVRTSVFTELLTKQCEERRRESS